MEGRCDGVGSGVNGRKPSVQEIQRGFLRGFLFFESDLFWWNFGAEALHTVNAKTAGPIFAQPTPWRFCVGCRSCPRESSSSNCSCVGLFCAYAARLVLRERLWARRTFGDSQIVIPEPHRQPAIEAFFDAHLAAPQTSANVGALDLIQLAFEANGVIVCHPPGLDMA